jgi:hypothetical protein
LRQPRPLPMRLPGSELLRMALIEVGERVSPRPTRARAIGHALRQPPTTEAKPASWNRSAHSAGWPTSARWQSVEKRHGPRDLMPRGVRQFGLLLVSCSGPLRRKLHEVLGGTVRRAARALSPTWAAAISIPPSPSPRAGKQRARWLSETQVNLARIDTQRRHAEEQVSSRTNELHDSGARAQARRRTRRVPRLLRQPHDAAQSRHVQQAA